MLASLVRLAPAVGMCSRPLCDWLPLRVCARVPCAIGLHSSHRACSAAGDGGGQGARGGQCAAVPPGRLDRSELPGPPGETRSVPKETRDNK
eukprot:124458-Pyramimonas_sp.AAC.2